MGLKSTKCTCPSFLKRSSFKNLSLFPLWTPAALSTCLSPPLGASSHNSNKSPFFRIPKTLGWPFLDFLPPRIRCLLPMEYNSGTYTWPLDWTPQDFTGNDVTGMQYHLPEAYALITSLGPTFIKRLTHSLLATDGHFASLLLSTIWGLTAGHTSLCVQGIFGSGKTYNSSLLVIILSTVLGLPTLISSEPNLPLDTAADTICDLLQDAPYCWRVAGGAPSLLLPLSTTWLRTALNSSKTTPPSTLMHHLLCYP